MEFRKTLSNGVAVIADTNPQLRRFSIIVRIRAGSAYESAEDWGITHMLEHCIIRSLKGQFEQDFYGLMSYHGIEFDLFTRPVHTEYQIKGSSAGIPFAVQMLGRMFLPIALSEQEFLMEKYRVLAEMRENSSEVDPFWGDSPMGRPVHGTVEAVEGFTRDRLNDYMKAILVSENVELCLTGCIGEEAMALLLDAAAAIPMYEGAPAPQDLPMPADFGQRQLFQHQKAYVDQMRFVYDVDARKWDPATVDLLNAVLFDGLDGLLYLNLSEWTGLVYQVRSNRRRFRGGGSLEFWFPYHFELLLPTVQAMDAMLTQVENGSFDLESKKRSLLAQWDMLHDEPFALGQWLLDQVDLTGSPEPPDWAAVTKEDVIACARQVFQSGLSMIWHQVEWEEVWKILEQAYAAEEEKEI